MFYGKTAYIMQDENGVITRLRFMDPGWTSEGWTPVEWPFPRFIMNMSGKLLYKMVGGKPVERAQEEISNS